MIFFKTSFLILVTFNYAFAIPGMESYLNMASNEENSDEHGQNEGRKSTNCSCGYTNKARIVGGKETLVNEFPLVAGLKLEGVPIIVCGGTILTPSHVVTAAHCTYPFKDRKKYVVVGEHDQSKDDESSATQVIPVEKAIDHEGYVHKKFNNDIALLLLEKKITFTQTVGPACLPSKRTNLLNEQIKVIGWGRLGGDKDVSQVLMKVNLRVIPLENCKENFPKKPIPLDEPKQICTYGNKKDSCQGDSGGPLIWLDPDTNRYTLVALVSYGKKDCATQAPAVNTDVSAYLDWIQWNIAATKPEEKTCAKAE